MTTIVEFVAENPTLARFLIGKKSDIGKQGTR